MLMEDSAHSRMIEEIKIVVEGTNQNPGSLIDICFHLESTYQLILIVKMNETFVNLCK